MTAQITDSADATFRFGERLAGSLKTGNVVAISGDLGSGKTVLVQGICSGLGVTESVTSPTFTLIQEYSGRVRVFHFDFYRLEKPSEIEDLDVNRYFESDGISLIEWAERAESLLPENRIDIRLERVLDNGRQAENKRRIRISGLPDKDGPG